MLPAHSKIDRFFASYGGKDKKYLCASEVEPVPMKVDLFVLLLFDRSNWICSCMNMLWSRSINLLFMEFTMLQLESNILSEDTMLPFQCESWSRLGASCRITSVELYTQKRVIQDIKCKAYKSLVRPTLEYACTVWDPYYSTSADNLEAVQRRAARWVMNNYDRECSVACMLKKLDWRVLAQRRADARIKLLSKILKEEVDIEASKYVKHQRNNIDLVTIFANCNYYEH